jgi:hypothetical protein
MRSPQNAKEIMSALNELTSKVSGNGNMLVFLALGFALYYICLRASTRTIYDQYERVGNPWWVPKILGKGPQTLFAEGYAKV